VSQQEKTKAATFVDLVAGNATCVCMRTARLVLNSKTSAKQRLPTWAAALQCIALRPYLQLQQNIRLIMVSWGTHWASLCLGPLL
jgi:hypothetical protein